MTKILKLWAEFLKKSTGTISSGDTQAQFGWALSIVDQYMGMDFTFMVEVQKANDSRVTPEMMEWISPNMFITTFLMITNWQCNEANMKSWQLTKESSRSYYHRKEGE